MAKPTTTVVRGYLAQVSPQRQQYKPYAYELNFDDVEVEIEVPTEFVVEKADRNIVLNLQGFKVILSSLADAVDEVHDAYVIKARKAGKF